jgi:hypothetical protein
VWPNAEGGARECYRPLHRWPNARRCRAASIWQLSCIAAKHRVYTVFTPYLHRSLFVRAVCLLWHLRKEAKQVPACARRRSRYQHVQGGEAGTSMCKEAKQVPACTRDARSLRCTLSFCTLLLPNSQQGLFGRVPHVATATGASRCEDTHLGCDGLKVPQGEEEGGETIF